MKKGLAYQLTFPDAIISSSWWRRMYWVTRRWCSSCRWWSSSSIKTYILLCWSFQAKSIGIISWLLGNHHHCAGGHVEQGEAGVDHAGSGVVYRIHYTLLILRFDFDFQDFQKWHFLTKLKITELIAQKFLWYEC